MTSRRKTEASLYDAVLYLAILHRSGAAPFDAVQSLAEYADYFGEAAKAFRQVVSDTRLGCTLHEGICRLAETTPSEKFRQFLFGYTAAVNTSGTAVPYLEDVLETLREEKRIRQEKYLSALEVFAEIYLTLFVALPLFAVITGMVLGMLNSAEPAFLSLGIPMFLIPGTAAYLLLLDSMDESISLPHRDFAEKGEELQSPKLRAYMKRRARQECRFGTAAYFTRKPETVFQVSLPAGILVSLPFTDFPYLWTLLFLLTVFVPYAVFHFLHEREQAAKETSVPDFCRRLAGAVSQGECLSCAIERIAAEEKSPLENDIRRLSGEIRLGETVASALYRFASRVKLLSVDRTVILLTESAKYSADISQTAAAASCEIKEQLRHSLARKEGMSLYTAVIYLAYCVFVFVAVILLTVFLPAMSAAEFSGELYETALINAVLIQGICSGLAAGKMGEGAVLAGVKHACVLFAAGMLVFFATGIL